MKKLLFTTLFCLVTSFTAQAQTKEETITWLQDKLSKYLRRSNECNIENLSVKVETCNFIISYSWNNTKYEEEVPTDNTTFSPYVKTKGKRIVRKNLTTNEKEYSYNIWCTLLPEAEEDLNVRVTKALNHLATFCPKKKETF